MTAAGGIVVEFAVLVSIMLTSAYHFGAANLNNWSTLTQSAVKCAYGQDSEEIASAMESYVVLLKQLLTIRK